MTGVTMPTGFQVDIEFVAGAWTNVTSTVLAEPGISIDYGRTGISGDPQVATCSLRLLNNGDFTPRNATGAYYPNVTPRKRIRVTYASGASPVFLGYIKQWQPSLEGGAVPVMSISAVDRMDALSRRALNSIVDAVPLSMAPVSYFPLTDPFGSFPNIVELVGNTNGLLSWNLGVGNTPVFGTPNPTPYADGRTGLALTPPGVQYQLQFPFAASYRFTSQSHGAWLTFPAGAFAGGTAYASITAGTSTGGSLGTLTIDASIANKMIFLSTTSTFLPADDGLPHHYMTTYDWTSGIASIYVDGVSVASSAFGATGATFLIAAPYLSNPTNAAHPAVVYSSLGLWPIALTAQQVADIYNAGANGLRGELSGTRATRLATAAGIATADQSINTGQVRMGAAVITGQSPVDAVQTVAATEGGGAAVYVAPNGKFRYVDRAYRSTVIAAITIDAATDIAPGTWAPTMDDLERINQSTVTRTGGGTPQIYTDTASVALLGTLSDSLSPNSYNDEDADNLAQWRVSSSTADVRFPKLAVNFATSPNAAALYTAFASIAIGSLLRINNAPRSWTRPGGTAVRFHYTSQIDAIVEGWSVAWGKDQFLVTFDLSPVQPRFILETSTVGRLVETASSMTLNGTITNSATSISVATSGGNPTFSTTAGDYSPTALLIKIDEEILSVTAAPGSSATPQTLTVSRGALGTFADAHTTGATVSVYTGSLVL